MTRIRESLLYLVLLLAIGACGLIVGNLLVGRLP